MSHPAAKEKIKILFILKKRSKYGVSYGLVNSCRFVSEALRHRGIECIIEEVIDNNCIDRVVHQHKPTHVFIEAIWVTPEKFPVLFKLHPKVKWFVRIHSQTPFLAGEGISYTWILKYHELARKHKNFRIACNAKRLREDFLNALDIELVYSPNIYLFDRKTSFHKYRNEKTINIGCFGAIRPFKNFMNQALAAIAFAKRRGLDLKFHINSSRFENHGENILKNLKAVFNDSSRVLVEHDWMNHADFVELVKTMDLGLQVSYTETFNIVAADFVANHIPIVGSPEIDWLSCLYQAHPNSIKDIVDKLDFAYNYRFLRVHALNEISLTKYNLQSIEDWIECLK